MSSQNQFKQKVIQIIVELTRRHLDDICEEWSLLFGHKYDDGLIVQLKNHYESFLKLIKNDNLRKIKKVKRIIEGK